MSSADEALISSSSGAEEFIVSLVTNLVLGIVSLIVISFLRRSASLTYFFDPRRSDSIRNPNYHKGSLYLERPPRQSTSFFGWIKDACCTPEDVYIRSVGVDGVVFLRFLIRCGIFLTVYAIAAFIVIVPVQASSAKNNGTRGFSALSILSLEPGSDKLWANLIFTYLFTGILLKLLHTTWFEMIELKQRWIANEQLLGQRLTVLVSAIPKQYSTSVSLFSLFEELYPGQVAGAYVVQTNKRLTELYQLREQAVAEINSAKGQIELSSASWDDNVPKINQGGELNHSDALAAPELSVNRSIHQVERPKMALSMCGEKNVDVIDYYTEKLTGLDNEIAVILSKISNKQSTPSSGDFTANMISLHQPGNNNNNNNTNVDDDDSDEDEETKKLFDHSLSTPHVGFVTFRSAVTAASVINSTISESIRAFNIRLAPEPSDISWFGINSSSTYRLVISTLLSIVVLLLIIFYAVPITFISALLTVESLSEIFPWLEPILTFSPVIKGIISGLLPSLAMIIFMALLPKILYAFGYLSGLSSHSEIAIYTFKRYFLFQFINFFLIACVSSTVFNEMQAIIDNPGQIPVLLASGLPQSALLFINYIMMRALFTNFFSIIDIPDIILNRIFYYLAKTPAATVSALGPSAELYHKNLPEAALIFIIAYTFGTIQPMMLVFAALYFFTMYFSKRFTLLFISVNPYQTGGGFWPLLFDRILLGMTVGQLCMLGLLGLKEQIAPTILMIPLIIFTVWFWMRYSNLYEATEHRLTLISAKVTDTAIDTLTSEQHQALVEGFDLPSGPVYLSLLPFLIPETMGDTKSREKTLKKLGVEDQSSNPNFDLYENLIPTNVTVHSMTENQDIPVSRDVISLPEQYHGDDVAMESNYKQWLYEHDLSTNQPFDILFNGFLPKFLVKRRQDKQKKLEQTKLTTAVSSSVNNNNNNNDDVEQQQQTANLHQSNSTLSTISQSQNKGGEGQDEDDDNMFIDKTKLTLEQRILLEQLVFRWRRSQQLLQRQSSVRSPELTGSSTQQQSNGSLVDIELDGDLKQNNNTHNNNNNSSHSINQRDDDFALVNLPLISLEELPSEDKQTPFNQQQLNSSRVSGVRRGTIVRLGSSSSVLLNNAKNNTQPSSQQNNFSSTSVLIPDDRVSMVNQPLDNQQHQQDGQMVLGISLKNHVPGPAELEQVMMRYFTPETNPHHYSRVANRVWGTTYITYRAIKQRRKEQSKEKKKEKGKQETVNENSNSNSNNNINSSSDNTDTTTTIDIASDGTAAVE